MDANSAKVLAQALSLPPAERAALADSLIESLDAGADEGADGLWLEEVRKRAADLDAGRVRSVAWSEVEARLRGRIG